mmetsp:Transcript_8824/g.26800  ORF Transcript_8824/g.26800 Transcript_8824/m.26800 type:complete len:311 (-) Transcript_8824:2243-3175(-)
MLEQVHAPRLALVHVARREVQPRERQQARRVRVALPQRVVVQLHRLFTLAHRLVVVLREVVADAGRLGALRGQRLWQLATHVGQLLLLQVERALQALAVRVAVAAALVHLGHDEPRIDVQLEVLHTVGVVLLALQALVERRHGRLPLLQPHQQRRQLQQQAPVGARDVDGLVVKVNGARVVVRGHERARDAADELRVLGLVLERQLKRTDRLLRLLNLHERLAQHAVRVIVGRLVHQVQVAAHVRRLVLAMVEEDVGHRHACLGVVRRQVGDLAQLLQRALHVAARYRKLRVRHRHAHLLARALKLPDRV